MIEKIIIISIKEKVSDALVKINDQIKYFTLFVVENDKIKGTITDGDIRRGLVNGCTLDASVKDIMNKNFIHIVEGKYDQKKIDFIIKHNITIVPLISKKGNILKVYDFSVTKSILPIDAVIMAGGKGSRLMPLTKEIPKPMLKVGGKPIIEYNIDLLKNYGIQYIHISVNYLAEKITSYFKDGKERKLNISYLTEDKPLGTIGALKGVEKFHNNYVLLMNSDLLTNIDLDAMFREFISEDADMIIASTDYKIQVPYGVIESNNNMITALKEKPTYTYFSNAGIYIFKKELVKIIPENTFFNATNFLDVLLKKNKKVLHYSIKNYWLDVGKHQDFEKAKIDIINLKL
ncbi:MAG: dTDP-glucose pyrophosphorylase [Planctomycetota bacterium]|jgi:dTDP-glucose pyrophosphorylase